MRRQQEQRSQDDGGDDAFSEHFPPPDTLDVRLSKSGSPTVQHLFFQ
jgi:hypothetical protein